METINEHVLNQAKEILASRPQGQDVFQIHPGDGLESYTGQDDLIDDLIDEGKVQYEAGIWIWTGTECLPALKWEEGDDFDTWEEAFVSAQKALS